MKTGKRIQSIVGAALLAILILPIGAGCGSQGETHPNLPTAKVVQAQTLTIVQEKTSGSYEATGSIRATLNAILASKVMGRVVSVSVREGDFVKKGQLLVSLDPRELEAAVNIASANLHSSIVGVANAATSAEMEDRTSKAKILQAESQVTQAQAALAAAEANRDLALAGRRTQEIAQSHLAVVQAESSLRLAKQELERTSALVQDGALARRELDVAQNRYEVAKAQFDTAVEGESIAREGSRSQEIRAAQDAVSQAKATVAQAKSGVAQAKAAALQILVRRKEIEVAKAQVEQSSAAVQSAQVGLSYTQVLAPFDGRVVHRIVDPGAMANPGTPLLEVEGGAYRLEASVPERLLKAAKVGSAASANIDSVSSGSLIAKVEEVVPQADSTTHAYVVKYSLPSNQAIRSGMFGRVTIRTGSETRTQIPPSATWEKSGLHYVFGIDKDGIARLRIVTVGKAVDGKVEVLSGLTAGDRIVVGDLSSISEGVRVEESRS